MGELGCSLEEAYDMTWAEFRIRSFAFNRQREWEMMMTREVAYEVFTTKFMFSKRTPPKKDRYWPIGDQERSSGSLVTPEMIEEFKEEFRKFKEKEKENGTGV